MKPAGKLKLWTGGYVNKPGVTPPVFLRAVICVLLLSLLSTLLYGVFGIMDHFEADGGSVGYMAAVTLLFFLSPFSIVYAISTNHPASRALLVAYCGALIYFILDSHYSISSAIEKPYAVVMVSLILGTVLWLYLSPRARVYYALIQDKPIPEDLTQIADKLLRPTATEKLAQRIWALIEPLAPYLTLMFALFLVYAGFRNLSP